MPLPQVESCHASPPRTPAPALSPHIKPPRAAPATQAQVRGSPGSPSPDTSWGISEELAHTPMPSHVPSWLTFLMTVVSREMSALLCSCRSPGRWTRHPASARTENMALCRVTRDAWSAWPHWAAVKVSAG